MVVVVVVVVVVVENANAFRRYIKVVLLETQKSWDQMDSAEQASALDRHPRIKELIDAHGASGPVGWRDMCACVL